MPKTIVAKTQINKDEKLALIKAFRITNKRAGETKRLGPEVNEKYIQYCEQLRDLAEQAENTGFFIWVNSNGQTGHTYGKDYKISAERLHDHDAHVEEVRLALDRQQDLLVSGDEDPDTEGD